MADNKTMPTGRPVGEFIAGVEPAARRAECAVMLDLMASATGLEPQMWGPSIVGYGRYAYTYASGHSGEAIMAGFSPRKQAMTVYVMPGFSAFGDDLARLGAHTHSVSCLYLKRLDRIDLAVLEALVGSAFEAMKARYPDWSST